ncbi:MAG: RdgB/HAM1 family non-canonical purine NTP pyrophosphatase [Synechococcus sp.]
MTVPLIVATGNPGKLKEFQQFFEQLGDHPWELLLKPSDVEIEETGTTFAENAILKARGVAIATGQWALADDSGLSVDALNGAPGVYSARYAPTPSECIDRLLSELSGKEERGAEFVCEIVLCRPDGSIAAQASARCRGEILTHRQGTGGFGYDPVFFVPEANMTFAEMPTDRKRAIGHRGKALQRLKSQLIAANLPLL